MTLNSTFERLSRETWQRLRDAHALGIRFGEETITDLLLLELKRLNPAGIRILQTPKSKEAAQGTDWEWWIKAQHSKWIRCAIQAKRLDRKGHRYDGIGHKVKSQLQIDLLDRYAKRNRAVPLYCLYNYVEMQDLSAAWQCGRPMHGDQLGCTLTPSSVVRKALLTHGGRTFGDLHRDPNTLPWRCWISCPQVWSGRRTKLPGLQDSCDRGHVPVDYFLHDRLPREVEDGIDRGLVAYFSAESYRTEGDETAELPRWIVVIDR